MRQYRIKQINDNTYVPQTKKWWNMWEGINRRGNDTWFDSQFQVQFCAVYSLEEANQIIKEYKAYWDKVKQYPKYHSYNK